MLLMLNMMRFGMGGRKLSWFRSSILECEGVGYHPMVESKHSFFEVQLEGRLDQGIEPGHAYLCLAGEIFDTVDVAFARGEPIGTVIHSEMLVETDIKQTAVTRTASA